MTSRLFIDGFNLSLEQGTGITTYGRMLARVAGMLGYEVGVVYGAPRAIPANRQMREIGFFDRADQHKTNGIARAADGVGHIIDHAACWFGRRPTQIEFSGLIDGRQFEHRLPHQGSIHAARNLYSSAAGYFHLTGRFVDLDFDQPPDIFHWTYQLPLRARRGVNVYTIHDLVPLRLPFATLDNKRHAYRLLRAVAKRADHIVTVSEHSRRDIIRYLGVSEDRVTNTYQAVDFPGGGERQTESLLAEQLAGSYGLERDNYLLFVGAMEPKKNLGRLIEAYLASGARMSLVLVASGGWQNEAELKLIRNHEILSAKRLEQSPGQQTVPGMTRAIIHLDYVSRQTLATLIQGARALLFPSLYEGFGLPVLEAMRLGTAVVTSRESSLPEIVGEAGLLVNPYDVGDIAAAIRKVAADTDLAADLARRGLERAKLFSVDSYRARLATLYASLS
jgi:glycosyltransferase involved in cell wall biosynthesis